LKLIIGAKCETAACNTERGRSVWFVAEEKVMKVKLIAATVLCICSAAIAQGAPLPRYSGADDGFGAQRSVFAPLAAGVTRGLTHSPNECAPDQAEPVWDGRSGLLGYICVAPTANL
jgi:hypothetical protein